MLCGSLNNERETMNDSAKDGVCVYRDERYTLGEKDGRPYLSANGRTFFLSCHPYEPCLYIKSENGSVTAVHNAFVPEDVLQAFRAGRTVSSITGKHYTAKDFCRMVEYAADKGDVGIDDAERAFGAREKSEAQKKKDPADTIGGEGPDIRPEAGRIVEKDRFHDLIAGYPDCVIDFCIVRGIRTATGRDAHRQALETACGWLFADGEETVWRYDLSKADARPIDPSELFAPANEKELNYRKAFLDPPCGSAYTDADFEKINAALFPNGAGCLEAYRWTTGWSDYFDEGGEWWGTLCLTVFDRSLDRFVVILASATD